LLRLNNAYKSRTVRASANASDANGATNRAGLQIFGFAQLCKFGSDRVPLSLHRSPMKTNGAISICACELKADLSPTAIP
jgi:hypothetical protein